MPFAHRRASHVGSRTIRHIGLGVVAPRSSSRAGGAPLLLGGEESCFARKECLLPGFRRVQVSGWFWPFELGFLWAVLFVRRFASIDLREIAKSVLQDLQGLTIGFGGDRLSVYVKGGGVDGNGPRDGSGTVWSFDKVVAVLHLVGILDTLDAGVGEALGEYLAQDAFDLLVTGSLPRLALLEVLDTLM